MTFETINVGSSPNDRTGDPLRDAFGKVNDNFAAIEAAGIYVSTVAGLVAAMDLGRTVYVRPGTYVLGDTVLRPVTGTQIIGVPGKSILQKATTGSTSYTKAIFDVEDVFDVTFEGLTFDINPVSAREYAFILRATSLGSCGRVRVRGCHFLNAPSYIQRYVDTVWVEDNVFDGEGASGALGGIGTGGVVDASGATQNTDGLTKNIWITGNLFKSIREEGVDINWNSANVTIDGNTFIDCNLSGGQEAIDVGGGVSPNNCYDISITNNKISFPTASGVNIGIGIKQGTQRVTIKGNSITSAITASGVGIRNSACLDVVAEGNTIEGFSQAVVGLTSFARFALNNNIIRSPGTDGINIQGTGNTDLTIVGNEITGGSATQQGIEVVGTVGFTISGNHVHNFDVEAIQIAATSSDGQIVGNRVHGCNVDGIRVLGPRVTVSGNTSYENGRDGFSFTAEHVIVTNNLSYNNATVTANRFGFIFNAACNYAVIEGNKAFDTRAGGSRTQGHGFSFGVSDRIIFDGNIMTNNVNGGATGTSNLTNSLNGAAGNVTS